MIEKEITMPDGKTYTVGFKEVGSDNNGLECHILEKGKFRTSSIYSTFRLKGLSPDYKQIAINTIFEYTEKQEQKAKLLSEKW